MKHAIGDKVKVTGNSNFHKYKIGEVVIIDRIENSKAYMTHNLSNSEKWYVMESDCEAVDTAGIAVIVNTPSDSEYIQKKAFALGWKWCSNTDYVHNLDAEVLFFHKRDCDITRGSVEYLKSKYYVGYEEHVLTKDIPAVLDFLEKNAPKKEVKIVDGGKYFAKMTRTQAGDFLSFIPDDNVLVCSNELGMPNFGWMPSHRSDYYISTGYTEIPTDQFIKHFKSTPKPLHINGYGVKIDDDGLHAGCIQLSLSEIKTIKKIRKLKESFPDNVFIDRDGSVTINGYTVTSEDVDRVLESVKQFKNK